MGTKRPGNVLDPDCPSRLVLDRLSEKWTGLVILALDERTLRFTELRARIGGVAPKVLSQTLRNMERDGLVRRRAYAEVPPRVEYSLTALGRSLCEPLQAVQDWAERNVAKVLAARERADATRQHGTMEAATSRRA
jgi:DNA-binding HxlR family transcriptional regulator